MQQHQHIESFLRFESLAVPMARLLTVAWTEPGTCDLGAMTQAIDAHVQRHDTYASRFVVLDDGRIERRVIDDRTAIHFEAIPRGEMAWEEWRESLLDTPGPLEWDCFRFHVVQYDDSFTVCACLDHLNGDGTFMIQVFADIHDTYRAVVEGEAPPVLAPTASYLSYCERQAATVRALTRESDEVRGWAEFLRPADPAAVVSLPVGEVVDATATTLSSHPLMDATEAEEFHRACVASGSRLIGGVLGLVAQAWTDLSGASFFRAITPMTNLDDHERRLYLGWFVSIVPVAFPVARHALVESMVAAQATYTRSRPLAAVPPGAVAAILADDGPIDVAHWTVPMISVGDFTRTSLTSGNRARWQAHDGLVMLTEGAANQVGLWINRNASGITVTTAFPDTPEARDTRDHLVHRMAELSRSVAMPVAG
ncbi:MAG: condensation domain-containing protein [Actinomycetota bacterium]